VKKLEPCTLLVGQKDSTASGENSLAKLFKSLKIWLGAVAQACNPSSLGGRDHGLKPAQAKSSRDSHFKSMSGSGGTHLSSQLHGEEQIGGSRSKPDGA
jgi:hypothetical protein